jgi:hypothetical protein
MTVQKMCLFLAIILQMVHDQRDMLKDCWSTLEALETLKALYGNTEARQALLYV